MKSILYAAIAASALAAPIAAFAQSDQPVTRAAVKGDLIQLEQNGYRPAARDPQYPADIQAAERRMQMSGQQQALTHADTSGYGADSMGAAQSGRRSMPSSAPSDVDKLYYGR